MKLAIMQPYFLPYIGYWQLIESVDKYVIYDDVNYIKKGWIDRNNYLINGGKKLVKIVISGASQNKLINEINILDDFSAFLRTIELNYKKAPFFCQTYKLLQDIVAFSNRNLAAFIGNSIRLVCNYLNIETELEFSSSLEKENSLKGESKIIDICKRMNASIYINAIGGTGLYHKERFEAEGLQLKFLRSEIDEYSQYGDEFIPGLSILDALMFNNISDIMRMLRHYSLVEANEVM